MAFQLALNSYFCLTKRLKTATAFLRHERVLTEAWLKHFEKVAKMRDGVYEQGRQVEEDEFPAMMTSFEPLCIELVQQFNVPLKEVE